MENKFKLMSWSIGAEVPFYDKNSTEGLTKFSQMISYKYKCWFETLISELNIVKMPSTNTMLLYTIVIRADNDLIDPTQFEADWEDLKEGVKEAFGILLKNVEFKFVE